MASHILQYHPSILKYITPYYTAMKSAQINEYGGSEIIKINQNTPEPTASSGKVLVTIKAAGVNPADWKIREGSLQHLVSLQFPSTLGMDFSGVIK